MAVTLATNKKDVLALVKLYSKGIEIKGDSRYRSFKPYLYISDNENKPIRINNKFILLENKIMKKEAVKQIVKETYENEKRSIDNKKTNKELFRKFKKRK